VASLSDTRYKWSIVIERKYLMGWETEHEISVSKENQGRNTFESSRDFYS